DQVGYAPVEEMETRPAARFVMGAHVPGEHELGEKERILPRQCRPVERLLHADDGTTRLGRGCIPRPGEGLDQAGLAGTGAAGDGKEAVSVAHGAFRSQWAARLRGGSRMQPVG